MVAKLAAVLPESASEIFESALSLNPAQVELWESYLKYQMGQSNQEEATRLLFERAYAAIGRHFKGVNFWLLWIDYQTSLYNMGFVNFISYQAVKMPLMQHERILGK